MGDKKHSIDHNVPNLIRILLMKQFYVSFLEYLNETAVFEIVLFSAILVTSILSQNYKLPILSIALYCLPLGGLKPSPSGEGFSS
jgi:hypothetical protein